MARRHILVKGRVQGVGFRWFVSDTAAQTGVSGWVRNLPDGSVEAEAEGEKAALDLFIEALRTGHPFARVDDLTVEDRPDEGERTFRIR